MTKVLIVDDDIAITTLLEKVLTFNEFKVIVVNDSSLALEEAHKEKPDLFILDLMMPEPNGFEVCRLLRTDEAFALTPILIITASDDYNSQGIAYAAGANDYITKPIDQDELPKRINSLLKK